MLLRHVRELWHLAQHSTYVKWPREDYIQAPSWTSDPAFKIQHKPIPMMRGLAPNGTGRLISWQLGKSHRKSSLQQPTFEVFGAVVLTALTREDLKQGDFSRRKKGELSFPKNASITTSLRRLRIFVPCLRQHFQAGTHQFFGGLQSPTIQQGMPRTPHPWPTCACPRTATCS